MTRLTALLGWLFISALRAADAVPAIRVSEIETPTKAAMATGPSVTVGPEGVVWLTWLEREGSDTVLKFSTLAPSQKTWSAARTIVRARELLMNGADFPALTVGPDGCATAVWSVTNPVKSVNTSTHGHHGPGSHAQISQTRDGGKTWSAPVPLTRESNSVEFVSLATLSDGRVLAVWLDGRMKLRGGKAQQLYSRILGSNAADVLVDASVCDCCQTALTAFLDGTALLAYRGRGDGEVRDIRVSRFRNEAWDESRPLNNDDWRINGCPVNGPQLASDGGRVAAAWFTAADNDPRVVASYSPDAGTRFLMPLRIAEDKPQGRVATTLLHDGALLISFVAADGGVWLRRVTPDFAAAEAVPLFMPAQGRSKGFPRLALRRNYDGGNTPAELVVAFAVDNAGLRTLLVSVPEGDLLEAEKQCDCAPTADQLRGFPLRGTIVGVDATTATVRVKHYEMPGVFAAATREFKVAPEVLTRAVERGRDFLGRIEKRNGAWWLIEVRIIATAPR